MQSECRLTIASVYSRVAATVSCLGCVGLALCAFIVTTPRFALAQSVATVKPLHQFVMVPYQATSAVQDADGTVYATLAKGGPWNTGALVRVSPHGVVLPLHYFEATEGDAGSLILSRDGFLYGVAGQRLFRSSTNGQFSLYPVNVARSALVEASDGNFYQWTVPGQTFLRVSRTGQVTQLTVSAHAAEPTYLGTSALMQASNGLLYFLTGGYVCGMTLDGTVVVFKPHGIASSYARLRDPLTEGADGLLYGSTIAYGDPGWDPGAVLTSTLDGTVIRSRLLGAYPDGQVVSGPLLRGTDGLIYGVIERSVVRVTPSLDVLTVATVNVPDAHYRNGGTLTFANGSSFAGLFFLPTHDVVFAGTAGAVATTVHDFTAGQSPNQLVSVIRGQDDVAYGVTARTGTAERGVLFRLDLDGTFTTLRTLDGPGVANLAQSPDGNLWGATKAANGSSGDVFRLGRDGTFHTYHVTAVPQALTFDQRGNLVVIANDRGTTCGTIERLTASGTFLTIHELDNEAVCDSRWLGVADDGTLYGVVGPSIFKVDTTDTYRLVRRFSDQTVCAAVQGVDGKVYGVVNRNGLGCLGGDSTLFRIEPGSDLYTPLRSFPSPFGQSSPSPSAAAPGSFYIMSSQSTLMRFGYDGTRANGVHVSTLAGHCDNVVWLGSTRFMLFGSDFGCASSAATIEAILLLNTRAAASVTRFDVGGDRKTDPLVFRPSTGWWYARNSLSGLYQPQSLHWGVAGDIPQFGDFDGDGLVDFTTYRPTTGEWSTLFYAASPSSPPTSVFEWGAVDDWPLTGDFDDDNVTDAAVYRPSTGQWFIRESTTAFHAAHRFGYFEWGAPGDRPVLADFDGDGRTDVTVYRPSAGQWFVRYSTLHYDVERFGFFEWGATGDVPLTGDFDGDGKANLVVYRPSSGYLYVRHSSTGYPVGGGNWIFQWGATGDEPKLGDYDGDGKSDIAVFRPSTGQWFIRYSSLGYDAARYGYFEWGATGDIALP